MNQLLTVFNGSTISSKIDLCGAYNLLGIKEGDEPSTAFRAKYGSYEYLVIPFGLTNDPASFQNLVIDIFAYFMDISVVVYLDDIMVFSSSEEEHVKDVASVLKRLRDNNLFTTAAKCGIPKDIKALESFLGLANFYHPFIKNYSKKVTALTSLPKKDSPFIFNEEALSQFQILKEAFTTTPILSHFNPSLQATVKTDASDYSLGAVLSQVLTDHSSLQYCMSSKVLTHCQARWAEFLSEFHFTISYFPGRLATLPDALSHQDDMYPERGLNFISKNPQNFHHIIKQDGIQESRSFSIKVEIFSDLVDQIQKEVWQDKDYEEIIKQIERGESVTDYSLEPQAKLLLFKDRVVTPRNEKIQLNILRKHHDSPLAGHPGQETTLKHIKREFH
ncbi:hypothetical protein O181_052262 [Austropuccinia psidii MF-1]|uniref:Reverse transcriptase domain-containing protein n=1 Tax=Austropuccinia psidii MF-1 TaxID=1389203 RepID=A0A9Q3HQC2_9BASI|nr:hypothetical protein [Austropuccinia psidii MF-1]